MESNIGVGILVGLATASSVYIWKSNDFTKTQKTILLLFVLFPPLQWVSIFIVLLFNKSEKEKSPEFIKETKINSTINNLEELKQKGILTEDEFNSKVKKIDAEKTESLLVNSVEYKQLKSLFESDVLTKEEFENKIELLSKKYTSNPIENEFLNLSSEGSYNSAAEKVVNENTTEASNSNNVLFGFIAIVIILIIYGVYNSNNNSYGKTYNTESVSPPMVADDVIDSSAITASEVYFEPMKMKKFVYLIYTTKEPNLLKPLSGLHLEWYERDKFFTAQMITKKYFSDIIEVGDYNEDAKNKLIDDFMNNQKHILLHANIYFSNSFVGESCGQSRREILENENKAEFINCEVFTFENYSDASISKRNQVNEE